MHEAQARLLIWPTPLPEGMVGLSGMLADLLGIEETVRLDDLGSMPRGPDGARQALVLVIDPAGDGIGAPERAISWLSGTEPNGEVDLVVITCDSYLGTDLPDRNSAIWGAAAVATVRSIAVCRGGSVRANVIAIPESFFGLPGELRGPLRQSVAVDDVAHAAAFLLSPKNDYLSGQVLFVDQGRHIFSSATA